MKKLSLLKNFRFSRLHSGPLLVWLSALICVVILFSHRLQRFEVLGIAQPQVHEVAATSTGRIKNITVQLFEEVKQGQIVAVFDDDFLDCTTFGATPNPTDIAKADVGIGNNLQVYNNLLLGDGYDNRFNDF